METNKTANLPFFHFYRSHHKGTERMCGQGRRHIFIDLAIRKSQ